jgi:hypothetical protein
LEEGRGELVAFFGGELEEGGAFGAEGGHIADGGEKGFCGGEVQDIVDAAGGEGENGGAGGEGFDDAEAEAFLEGDADGEVGEGEQLGDVFPVAEIMGMGPGRALGELLLEGVDEEAVASDEELNGAVGGGQEAFGEIDEGESKFRPSLAL